MVMPQHSPAPITQSEHHTKIRVYFEDTDAFGIVYYANYLKYAERARAELLRDAGFLSSELLIQDAIALVVKNVTITYFLPARLDDHLSVKTKFEKIRGASIEAVQIITRRNRELVRLELKIGCMHVPSGKPQRLPEKLIKSLSKVPLNQCNKIDDKRITNG